MESNIENGVAVNALKAHLALNVSDVTESIEFYRKLFGIEPSKVRTGYAKFDVQNPPLNFTLEPGQRAESRRPLASGYSGALDRGCARNPAKMERSRPFDARRNADELLLRDAGQNLGARPGRQRVGSLRGAWRTISPKPLRANAVPM